MSLFQSDKRTLIVAMDHAELLGVVRGLEDPEKLIDDVVNAGADGLLGTFGLIKHFRSRLAGRISTILRLDSGPSIYRQDWMAYTEWSLVHTVQDALALGADAVAVMAFIGSPIELETLRIVSRVASECTNAKLPLIVEAIPCRNERIPDTKAADVMASAARIAFEHGADLIKTYYSGSPEGFRHVVETCPVPVLVAGGAKTDRPGDAFEVVHGALEAGAVGAVFGRNIWGSGQARPMIAAFKQIIHGAGSVTEAEGEYERELARADGAPAHALPA